MIMVSADYFHECVILGELDRFDVHFSMSEERYEVLKKGGFHLDADAKCAGCFEQNVLYIYRQITEECMFKVVFEKGNDEWFIESACVNRELVFHNHKYLACVLIWWLRVLGMGEWLDFPVPRSLNLKGLKLEVFQCLMTGVVFPFYIFNDE